MDLRCGGARLRLEPAPGGEVLLLEGISGRCMAAGPAVAAAGERAAAVGGDLAVAGGCLRFEILGIAVAVGVEAAAGGGLRVRCTVGAGPEELVYVDAVGVRPAMADVAGYLEWCGDRSVAADGGVREAVPGFDEWLTSDGSRGRQV